MTEPKELYEQLISGQTSDVNPQSRVEEHLLYMMQNGIGNGSENSTEPRSRIEAYLLAMIEVGIAGAGSGPVPGPVGDVSWNDLTDKPFGEEPDGTIKKLDEKYLPDNLVTTNELGTAINEALPDNLLTTDNISSALPDDLVTTSELNAAINNALGVIENGTY